MRIREDRQSVAKHLLQRRVPTCLKGHRPMTQDRRVPASRGFCNAVGRDDSKTPITVLHVDDEPDFADMASEFLEREDERLEVITETSTEVALDRLAGTEIDCIVSDYDMPGRDGLEFLAAVRAAYPELPFILFTGKGSEEVASEALTKGATDYLQKGAGSERYQLLANRITNAVDQYRSRRRVADLEQVRTLASDISQSLIHATSRDDIEARISEIFTDAEPYRHVACIRVDPETGQVESGSGVDREEEFLDVLQSTLQRGESADYAPVGQAIEDRDIVVSESVQDDQESEHLRSFASEQGFRSLAIVPMHYEESLYGLLALFTDRPNPFDETEQELLLELGDDIAHAIHAQEVKDALRQTRDQFRALFENAPGPVITGEIREDRHIVQEVNEAFTEAFGVDPDAAVGEDVSHLIVPEERRERHQEFRRKAAAGDPVVAEVNRETADGTREFLLNIIPFGVTDGQADGWFAWYTDISDRSPGEDRKDRRTV